MVTPNVATVRKRIQTSGTMIPVKKSCQVQPSSQRWDPSTCISHMTPASVTLSRELSPQLETGVTPRRLSTASSVATTQSSVYSTSDSSSSSDAEAPANGEVGRMGNVADLEVDENTFDDELDGERLGAGDFQYVDAADIEVGDQYPDDFQCVEGDEDDGYGLEDSVECWFGDEVVDDENCCYFEDDEKGEDYDDTAEDNPEEDAVAVDDGSDTEDTSSSSAQFNQDGSSAVHDDSSLLDLIATGVVAVPNAKTRSQGAFAKPLLHGASPPAPPPVEEPADTEEDSYDGDEDGGMEVGIYAGESPQHRELPPPAASSLSSRRSRQIKQIKRRHQAFGNRMFVTMSDPRPQDVVAIESHRYDELWYINAGSHLECDWCMGECTQISGQLQGAEGRSQFAQCEFVCLSCLEQYGLTW